MAKNSVYLRSQIATSIVVILYLRFTFLPHAVIVTPVVTQFVIDKMLTLF